MDGEAVRTRKRKKIPEWAKITLVVAGSIVLVTIIIAVVFIGIYGLFANTGSDSASKAFTTPGYSYIAKIKVVGEIGGGGNQYFSSDNAYHHAWTMQTIDTLINDNDNQGIFLWLNTPGGTVYESDELYLKLMEYKEKTERPIYTYMGQLAASGGYYVAAASDEIYANRNTWTGSIGVTMGTFLDVSEFLSEHGIHTNTITSGRNKAMGNYYEPLTKEQLEIFQSLVDDAYDRFVAIVAEGRGLPDKDVRILADGRIYTATQALEAGLVDCVMGEKEAEEAIKGKFEGEVSIVNCYYQPDTYFSLRGLFAGDGISIRDLLRGGPGHLESRYEGDVAAVLELVRAYEETGAPPLRYLYTG